MFKPGLLDRIALGEHLRLATSPDPRVSVSQLLHAAYRRALADRPNEYIFKNEIANQLFVAHHSPDRSGLLTEFRVGSARLDVVVANGTTTCYEIKTDRDELRRLPNQLVAALSVFDKVYVVTTPRYLDATLEIISSQSQVGIFVLDASAKLVLMRRASSNIPQVDPKAIFDCLRRSEYVSALARRFGSVPAVPNTRIYSICKEMFSTLTPMDAHRIFTKSLQRRACRKGDANGYLSVPYELRLLYFTADPKQRERYSSPKLYAQAAWS